MMRKNESSTLVRKILLAALSLLSIALLIYG